MLTVWPLNPLVLKMFIRCRSTSWSLKLQQPCLIASAVYPRLSCLHSSLTIRPAICVLCPSSDNSYLAYPYVGGQRGAGRAVAAAAPSTAQLPASPSESVDSRNSSQGPDMGYDAFIEKNRASSVSSTLRRKSLQMTKSITHSMGESSGNRRAISRSSGFLLAARGALWRLVEQLST
ncbi:hypothetical protein H2248_011281 [Termitomyces sp. 'cryptogamus']|nr:hypothetical protein H2248_011281 [Termitomyces sp. 'cryptogamus']